MTTRRSILQATALGAVAASSRARAAVRTVPDLEVPRGACDCHVHVFPDPARFPLFAGRTYTPPVATPADLLQLQRDLHLDRVVIVQPSVYGTDNRATLDGIRELGPQRARGLAVIDAKTTPAQMEELHQGGIRGVRVNLETAGVVDPAASAQKLKAAVEQVQARGWHVQAYTRLSIIEALKDELARMPVPLVVDHFGGARAGRGVSQPGFAALLDLVRSGKAYVKISGAYRSSDAAPDFADAAPLARALIAANPDRILWGTDWPHTNSASGKPATEISEPLPIDDGRLFNQLAKWAPDAATRRRILVDNPARLYGFA
ncbi:amidohydrolase family protein [Paracraurococcus lichenis]|uniref:Amidohydrolase family protein n=1 Tax=Paracraurococcus lichenis TaxID=3064888 RepID=A0ABT9E5E7_9PROT|nr:amidohydrolase family protein [Paracraurococcus sp. LOR1-02]MDO9711397.1 amidohydrolase family protein [Paracraurococcus sp. LOR1-02]